MWRYQQGTPCPPALAQHTDIFSPLVFVDKQQQQQQQPAPAKARVGNSANKNVIDDVFEDYNDNTTRNISKLMRDEFKNARLGMPQKPRRAQAVSVFEEGVNTARPETRHVEQEGSGLMGGGAIKARRPQKIKLETLNEDRSVGSSFGTRKSAMHEASIVDMQENEYGMDENSHTEERATIGNTARDSRRRTIWVPSDDTTIMSIHPGAYDHTLRDDTLCLPPQRGLNTRTPRPEPLQQTIQAARQSMSVAPKRAPLRALAPVQPNAVLKDRVKCTNGKENIPPGATVFNDKSEKVLGKLDAKPTKTIIQSISKPLPPARTSLLAQPTAASQARVASLKKRSAPEPKEEPRKPKAPLTKDFRQRLSTETKTSLKIEQERPTTRHSLERQPEKTLSHKIPTSNFQPRVNANLSRYPVLPDDLVQPELYEDNWLSHQEIALTQLVNSVFQQAGSTSLLPRDDVASLRSKLLRSYQDSSVVTLHKRLKASLVYGALSMPKDSKDLPRLREDVGLRRQFLDLWVQSYNLDALQAAAEVVVGRAMTSGPRTAASIMQSLGSTSGNTGSVKEKEIRRFLLTFLVHHEDAIDPSVPQQKYQRGSEDEQAMRVGTPEWFWQRTVLNSLMLINLLDKAKTSGRIINCLFQASSIRKSSNSMLHALTRMVLPWIGDVTRPLGYLDFAVPHNQLPLSEYTYRIDNLATDLRNGVLLTRFVELLLYPTSTMQFQLDQTLTLSLPDGETLTSILSSSSGNSSETWILSQHLKFPCAGRAQKLHNASIALSALETVNSSLTTAAITTTSAADIVDGHREKTLSLLWSLVTKFGLGHLVDWDELKRETTRFAADDLAFDSRRYLDEQALEDQTAQPDTDEQARLLKTWAAAICATKGITVTNLTTSFCSGDALGCIIAAYSEFLPARATTKNTGRHANPTAEALKTLGCSDAFTSLFATTTAIPARSTTTALLAFLASRLLPLARSHRAAKTLQRAYRLRLARRTATQRVVLMRLARDCAEVVRVQKEVLDKVVLLQRTWRGVLAAREMVREDEKRALDADVEVFQRMARGWAVRKELRGVCVSGIAGGRTGGRRVMGGW